MRSGSSRRSIGRHAALVMLVFATADARACITLGTDGPCHCVENMMLAVTRAAEPYVATTLTGSAQPADAVTKGVEVGSNYYHTDVNPGDGAGDSSGNVTIHVGDTVTWNDVSGFHTVTSVLDKNDPRYFNDGGSAPGDTYSHTFAVAGTYQYYCEVHSQNNNGVVTGPQVGVVTVLSVPEPAGEMLLVMGGMFILVTRRWSGSGRAKQCY